MKTNEFDHKCKITEQGLSINAIGRSACMSVLDKILKNEETHKNTRSARVLLESSLAKVRSDQSQVSRVATIQEVEVCTASEIPRACY